MDIHIPTLVPMKPGAALTKHAPGVSRTRDQFTGYSGLALPPPPRRRVPGSRKSPGYYCKPYLASSRLAAPAARVPVRVI